MDTSRPLVRSPSELTLSQLAPHRPTVGDEVGVVLWRAIRLVGLYSILGDEAETITYLTGKHIGMMLDVKSVEELGAELTRLKLGKLTFPVNSPEEVHMDIAECVTCDGISPPIGRPVCQLEVGIVAGALERMHPGKKVTGFESLCIGGLGDAVCRVECKIF